MPLHFHLLSDEEIGRLEVVMRVVRDNRAGILDLWYELYTLHFGPDRTLSRPEFDTYFGADLDAVVRAVLDGDVLELADSVRSVGRRFAERGVPFAEIIASMHLFEESCGNFFRRRLPVLARGPGILLLFDKLSHVRMILLAEVYFASRDSGHAARELGLERDLDRLDPMSRERTTFHGLVGASARMRQLYEQVQAAASTGATILITGESGTGKELLARAVHECGSPSGAPFVALNCAALPQDLIESELFGHRKGSFSGATGDALGLVRAAEGGTLFLDEITEMPLSTQAKLLRVLQERTVRPVGSTSEIPVRLRFIASTNRPIQEAIASGRLREDLYYRLQGHTLALSPLRERADDVALLVEHCIDLFNRREGRSVSGIDPEALSAMQAYPWPGNVRELMNAIAAAFTYGKGDRIQFADLPPEVRGDSKVGVGGMAPPSNPAARASVPTFEESERQLLHRALDATHGNKVRAAKMLGISRKQLYAKLAKYAIDVERMGAEP
jgi:DNA-binding NtrC family response regulator